jgi:hypothetical protein
MNREELDHHIHLVFIGARHPTPHTQMGWLQNQFQGYCQRLQMQPASEYLRRVEQNGRLPPSDAVEMYVDVVANYLQYIQSCTKQRV